MITWMFEYNFIDVSQCLHYTGSKNGMGITVMSTELPRIMKRISVRVDEIMIHFNI
jgi:hypothetical protein